MKLQPTKALEHSLYGASVLTGILLLFTGFREPIALIMLLVFVISEGFQRWRGPQTIQEESLRANDLTALNIPKK
jgi:hypothetical protein